MMCRPSPAPSPSQRDEDKTLMFKNACLYTYGLVANLGFRMYSVMTEDDAGSLLDLSCVAWQPNQTP
jgi:hypothetical protein